MINSATNTTSPLAVHPPPAPPDGVNQSKIEMQQPQLGREWFET